jgi:hypothetical protein
MDSRLRGNDGEEVDMADIRMVLTLIPFPRLRLEHKPG